MSDYFKLDCAIMTAICNGKTSFNAINATVEHLAKSCAFASSSRPDQAFRVVDRRLQALRKRGLIAFNGKRWSMTNSLDVSQPQDRLVAEQQNAKTR